MVLDWVPVGGLGSTHPPTTLIFSSASLLCSLPLDGAIKYEFSYKNPSYQTCAFLLELEQRLPLRCLFSAATNKCNIDVVTYLEQEGWLSPTERASVSAISLRHIIWLPHESHAGMSLPTADLRMQPSGIWLRQESLRHILASPGYAPGTIAVNVTFVERGFNACQTLRSIYPSIFNRFPVIQPVNLKIRHFTIFFAHFGLPRYRTPL